MKILSYIPILITGLTFAQSQNQNYIKTTTYTKPNQEQAIESIQYFDGLGRPIQAITKGQATGGQDIVQHIEYDTWGRQSKEFLPLINGSGSLNFRDNAGNTTLSFYNDILGDGNAFAEKNIENSPLNRVLAQGAPGTDWALTNGHTIRFQYQANSYNDKVVQIKVNLDANFVPTFTVGDFYPDNTLYKNVTTDENGNNSEEYKNTEGQVILKRTFATMANVKTPLNTYYVYDIYGNLTLVVPPKIVVSPNVNLTNDQIVGLCYKYTYNEKNELVNKSLPDQSSTHNMYYDNKGRLFAQYTLRGLNGPIHQGNTYYIYDNFNRVIKTLWREGSFTNGQNQLTDQHIMSKNFYDNYQFLESLDFAIPTSILGEAVNTAVKGQTTGTFVRNLDPLKKANVVGDYTVILYDAKYRPIANYTFFDNKGFTKTEMLLDWQGRVLETHTTHKENENASLISTKEVFTYNDQNQLITHTHQINNGVIETLANNTYNAIGQLQQKNVGGNGTALQAVTYNYNIRGWLTDINNINQPNNKLFNFKLEYNNPSETARNNGAVPLYNGNISATYWQNELDNKVRSYAYKYDEISRLTNAKYVPAYQGETENFDEDITYDRNGNILTLKRKGLIDPLNPNTFDLIDDLAYNYWSVNNRLRNVIDKSYNDDGYKAIPATNNATYAYDQNGNLLSDQSKGITNIEYNYLDLPTLVLFSNGTKIEYIYNANGTKIAKKVYQDTNQPPVVTTYRNGFQYIDGVLKFFPHAEGYVNVAENQNFEYIYNYTDHLGNVRVSYKYDQTATETNNIAIVDANNYYPFGLKHKGYGSPNQTPNYKYKYNGKELQDELGVNWYDYGARNYDAALGRWMNVDPLAEKFPGWSPYNYAMNNPIYYIDPDGMAPRYNWEEHDKGNTGIYTDDKSQENVDFQTALEAHGLNTVKTPNNETDPPKQSTLSIFKQFLLAIPVLGPTIESSDYIDEGNYAAAFSSFGIGVLDLITLGTASKYSSTSNYVVKTSLVNSKTSYSIMSKFAKKNNLYSTNIKSLNKDIVDKYYKQMLNKSFNSYSTAIFSYNDKIIISEGNHRISAAIKYGIETGDNTIIQKLINNARVTNGNPSDYGLQIKDLIR